jgi:hypothetical protein
MDKCMSNNKEWYNDIQRQSSRAKVKEKTSTVSNRQIKQEWGGGRNTGLFKMIVAVFTTFHTQYT